MAFAQNKPRKLSQAQSCFAASGDKKNVFTGCVQSGLVEKGKEIHAPSDK